MRGDENFKQHETIRRKEYFIPNDDHPIRQHLQQGLEDSDYGNDVIDAGARLEVMIVYPYISKKTVARVFRASNHVKLFSGFDYVVEISGQFWDMLPAETHPVIMMHECCHMHVKTDKQGRYIFQIIDHNVKDFHSVIEKYGIDWLSTLGRVVADATDAEEDEVRVVL
jgi:predicted metallopeptidase